MIQQTEDAFQAIERKSIEQQQEFAEMTTRRQEDLDEFKSHRVLTSELEAEVQESTNELQRSEADRLNFNAELQQSEVDRKTKPNFFGQLF